MKKVILLVLTVVALSSYGQKVRFYKDCAFWINKNDVLGKTKRSSVKLIWDNDDDSPTNLIGIFYPNKKVILDKAPEFQGMSDGYPYYYFKATENGDIHVIGTIVRHPNGEEFSVSIIYDYGETHTVALSRHKFKYIPTTSEYNY